MLTLVFLSPEDGESMVLRNVCMYLKIYYTEDQYQHQKNWLQYAHIIKTNGIGKQT
jgi:hypothetical protein